MKQAYDGLEALKSEHCIHAVSTLEKELCSLRCVLQSWQYSDRSTNYSLVAMAFGR